MRTGNPTLKENIFTSSLARPGEPTMTITGTVHKTFLLVFLLLLPASWVWGQFFATGNPATVIPYMAGGGIVGFIIAMVTVFRKTAAPFTAPIYAACQGLMLGGVSAILEAQFPGIVIQAVGLTVGTLLCLLMAYRSGLIKVTENFKLGVVAATGAVALIYLASFAMRMFGMEMPFIHEGGTWGIIISLVIVVIAALNLVLDFDFIEKGEEAGAPKFMEWYAAFGLLVTLVWLYLEILRLLAKTRD